MDNFLTTMFSNSNNKSENNSVKEINEDLNAGKRLKSKRRKMIKKLKNNTDLIEGFDTMPLPPQDENEFNEKKDAETKAQKEASSLATSLQNSVNYYITARQSEKDCKKTCSRETNVLKKKACLAGCQLSEVFLEKKVPIADGIKFGEKIKTCKSLESAGPQYCNKFISTKSCYGRGSWDGKASLTNGSKKCNTNIPSNVSGMCICKNGSVKATVDCGHANFNCNQVCQPNGQTYNFSNRVNCQVSGYGGWSRCNASCGYGRQYRRRRVIKYPKNGGSSCPSLVESKSCKQKDCKVLKCVPVPRIQAMGKGYFTESAARAFASSRGLRLGGRGYSFGGNYTIKGLYAYRYGRYGGMAFFGRGGSVSQMKSSSRIRWPIYRPGPYDYGVWKNRCNGLPSYRCNSGREYSYGSGGRCNLRWVNREGFTGGGEVTEGFTGEEVTEGFASCAAADGETIKGYRGVGYRGCQNKTKSGKTCQKWTSQYPHRHSNTPAKKPNKGLGNHNYCRNPDNTSGGIWCYTTDSRKRWEYCSPKKETAKCGAGPKALAWNKRNIRSYPYGWDFNKWCNRTSSSSSKCEATGYPNYGYCKNTFSNTDPNNANVITGNQLVDKCNNSKSGNIKMMGPATGLPDVYDGYQDQERVVNDKAKNLQDRINSILNSRKGAFNERNSSSQELIDELASYQKEYALLKKVKKGETTLTGREEDVRLKKSSAKIKYAFWLGLAICVLIGVIKQLKK